MNEPLDERTAERLIRDIIKNGQVAWSGHVQEELKNDKMTTGDALNVMRAGAAQPAELVKGSWRYRIRTSRMTVVVAFRSERELVVVTAWR